MAEEGWEVGLSLEEPYWASGGFHSPSLAINPDSDSSLTPDTWVWFMFSTGTDGGQFLEDWFKLSYEEVEEIHRSLGEILSSRSENVRINPDSLKRVAERIELEPGS